MWFGVYIGILFLGSESKTLVWKPVRSIGLNTMITYPGTPDGSRVWALVLGFHVQTVNPKSR